MGNPIVEGIYRRALEQIVALLPAGVECAEGCWQHQAMHIARKAVSGCVISTSAVTTTMPKPFQTKKTSKQRVVAAERRRPLEGAKDLHDQLRRVAPSIVSVRVESSDRVERREYECPMCWRRGLESEYAFWSHVRNVHRPDELRQTVLEEEEETFESALIRVCNATDVEEAVRVATSALSRKEERTET